MNSYSSRKISLFLCVFSEMPKVLKNVTEINVLTQLNYAQPLAKADCWDFFKKGLQKPN